MKIDEFALHPDQRLLYKIAKPVISLAFHSLQTPGATADHSLLNGPAEQKLAVAVSSLQSSVEPKIDVSITTWFLPKQLAWINDIRH